MLINKDTKKLIRLLQKDDLIAYKKLINILKEDREEIRNAYESIIESNKLLTITKRTTNERRI